MNSIGQAHEAQATRALIMWLALGLAMAAALMYVLIALDVLGVGMQGASSDALVAWILGTSGYVLGGLLILTRRRGLWITGAVINGLVLLFFVQKYIEAPEVMFSPGGLATKIPQLLLEVALLYLIATTPRTQSRQT